MNILAVEANWWDRKRLTALLNTAIPDANICAFRNTVEALEFAKTILWMSPLLISPVCIRPVTFWRKRY